MNDQCRRILDEARNRVEHRHDVVAEISEPEHATTNLAVADNVVDWRDRRRPAPTPRAPKLDTPMVSVVAFESALVAERAMRIAAEKNAAEQIQKVVEAAADLAAATEAALTSMRTKIAALEARLETHERSRPATVDDTRAAMRAH